MGPLFALFLGIVQGLTEFFPVSSSAHLTIAKIALGITTIPPFFDLSCHMGTLGALVIFFRKDLFQLFTIERKKLFYFFIALLPLIPFYFLLKPFRQAASATHLVGIFLFVTGCILLFGTKVRLNIRSHFLRDVFLIGTAQSAALLPGISRSGSTIACAKLLGWEIKEAVRFSFLLSIPTILGGALFEGMNLIIAKEVDSSLISPCLIGFFSSFIVGMLMIKVALRWLEKGKFTFFGWYCIALGIATLILV